MNRFLFVWCALAGLLIVGCDTGGDAEVPASEPEAVEAEASPAAEPASQPTTSAEEHAGHAHDEHAGHAHGEPSAAPEHRHDLSTMANVLEEGSYDPATLVAQPGASVGDAAICPVSGSAFRITEDSPFFDHEGQRVFFCCASCVRPFQREPSTYLAAAAAATGGMVEVSADGNRYDPPVPKARVPAGSWICDMGTVHYAQSEQGEGTCPICRMDLVHFE